MPDAQAPLRAEVDRLFDRELDEAARERLVRTLRERPAMADEVRQTSDALRELRRPIPTPDFTESVLAHAESNDAFLTARHRRRVRRARRGVGAVLLAAVAGLAVVHRLMPGAFAIGTDPTPLSDITDAVSEDVSDSIERIERIASELPERSPTPADTSAPPVRLIVTAVETDLPDARELSPLTAAILDRRAAATVASEHELTLPVASAAGDPFAGVASLYVFAPIEPDTSLVAATFEPTLAVRDWLARPSTVAAIDGPQTDRFGGDLVTDLIMTPQIMAPQNRSATPLFTAQTFKSLPSISQFPQLDLGSILPAAQAAPASPGPAVVE